ncbi:MAG: hypothetical protein SFU83_07460 [Meiothermus sp.]|nr:hypothetical protein [Meiothermus sp.]
MKSSFTSEEWALLARAPFMVGLLVTLAAPSGISGVLEESGAVTENLLSLGQTHSPLIQALAADIRGSQGQLARPVERLT